MSGEQVVGRYLEIMNALDMDALAGLLTDDVVVRLPFAPDPVPKETVGKVGVLALYGGFPSLVSPLGFHDADIRPLAADGEFVAEYRSDCTMLATGLPYRNSYVSLFTVRGDRLASIAEFFDPLVFLAAQGVALSIPTGI